MAGPTKKPRKPTRTTPQQPETSSDEESDEGTYYGQKEVQATFEGRNPEGQDFHGIKQLLTQSFLKAHIDLSEISDMLIAQTGVGSVLKQSFNDSDDEEDVEMVDDADVFGITSVINLSANRDKNSVKEFYTLLQELCEKTADNSIKEKVGNLLSDCSRLGFLINERFVNIPAKISSVMLSSLYEEIERKAQKVTSYNFEYYIMICKTSRPKANPDSEEMFTNDEEVIFLNAAHFSFDFSVAYAIDSGLAGKWLSEDEQLTPYRRILFFQANKFQQIISQVTALVQ